MPQGLAQYLDDLEVPAEHAGALVETETAHGRAVESAGQAGRDRSSTRWETRVPARLQTARTRDRGSRPGCTGDSDRRSISCPRAGVAARRFAGPVRTTGARGGNRWSKRARPFGPEAVATLGGINRFCSLSVEVHARADPGAVLELDLEQLVLIAPPAKAATSSVGIEAASRDPAAIAVHRLVLVAPAERPGEADTALKIAALSGLADRAPNVAIAAVTEWERRLPRVELEVELHESSIGVGTDAVQEICERGENAFTRSRVRARSYRLAIRGTRGRVVLAMATRRSSRQRRSSRGLAYSVEVPYSPFPRSKSASV